MIDMVNVQRYKLKTSQSCVTSESRVPYLNEMSRDGALGSITSALGVARAGTPYQGELNGSIPADTTPLESPYSDGSVAANTSCEAEGSSDSDISSCSGISDHNKSRRKPGAMFLRRK
jgi:hypothetical protein